MHLIQGTIKAEKRKKYKQQKPLPNNNTASTLSETFCHFLNRFFLSIYSSHILQLPFIGIFVESYKLYSRERKETIYFWGYGDKRRAVHCFLIIISPKKDLVESII
jgi:hypothetical protein